MFIKKQFEETIEEHEKKIESLEKENLKLDAELNHIFDHLKLTPEQLQLFVADSKNFEQQEWEEMQEHKQKLDAKLSLDLANIRNPLKNKKTYSERRIEHHWLFVR